MLSKLRQAKKEKGFTIIEVLIVLAIAGLILLVVFLAVPALQRNSRNEQRKADVARVGSAVQEFINNNNGAKPATTDNAAIQALLGTLAYYENTNVTVAGDATGTATNTTTVDQVRIYTAAQCAAITGGGRGAISGTARQIAIAYSTETGSGTARLCIES
jgi:prepilin-type N-terminal cleavage/methylation domain-containing protein